MPQGRGVYIHIPFCLSKCTYCDFDSQPLSQTSQLTEYISALLIEISGSAFGETRTIYFGGGTPSLCPPELLAESLNTLAQKMTFVPGMEISLEMNPATFSSEAFRAFRAAGINRISLGVQSTSDDQLKRLGRRHSVAQAQATVAQAQALGFDNLACDLIYGLPGQTLVDFKKDIKNLIAWGPQHLSLYALTLESHTVLAKQIKQKLVRLPDDDLVAEMYEWARDFLPTQGYEQYELSNFSLPGKACQHNLGYWMNREYFGFGASAHAYLEGIRSWNQKDPVSYLQSIRIKGQAKANQEQLLGRAKLAETLILGLRMTAGVEKAKIAEQFGDNWKNDFNEPIGQMKVQGLVQETEERISLTLQGMLLANVVFRALL